MTSARSWIHAAVFAASCSCGRVGFDSAEADATAVAYRDEVLADAPVAYWRLGETVGATTAADASGNGHDGMYDGAALGTSGALVTDDDDAAGFDGVDDRIRVPPAPAWRMGFDSFTLEAWVRADDAGSGHGIIGYFFFTNIGSSLHQGWQLSLGSPTSVHLDGTVPWLRLFSPCCGEERPFVMSALPPGRFVHLVITVDRVAQRAQLYIDGEPTERVGFNQPESIDPAGPVLAPEEALELGVKRIGSTYFLTGGLDEVAVYRSLLDADRVRAHFRAR